MVRQIYQYILEVNPSDISVSKSCSSPTIWCTYAVVYANFENQLDPNNFEGYCATNYNNIDLTSAGWANYCKNK